MKSQIQIRKNELSGHDRSMRTQQPGRRLTPPKTELSAGSGLLKSTVGRGGDNHPDDLKALGEYLHRNGAPFALIAQLITPLTNGPLIERYQREVLGFRNPDGRIDPGGKTIGAIQELQGREIVIGWFARKKEGGKDVKTEAGEIPSVLSESQFFSQYDQGAPCVPLSLLKANLGKRSSERSYRNVGCYQTCRYMLMQAGFTPGSKSDAEYLLEMETSVAAH